MKFINQKKLKLFGQFLVALFLAAFILEGLSMSFFSKAEEVVLFSEMEGHITLNGKPVKGAVIERWIKWKDKDGEKDQFTIDDNGAFSLPEIKVNAKLASFSQLVISQELKVIHQNVNYNIWALSKMNKNEYGELDGKPVDFRCELSTEEKALRFKNSYLLTNCEWTEIINID